MLFAVFVVAQLAPRQRDNHLSLPTGNVKATRPNDIDLIVDTYKFCRRFDVPGKIVHVTLGRIAVYRVIHIFN